VIWLFAMACGALTPTLPTATPPRNVLIILADDLGPERVSAYGSALPTPNIDFLADEGLRFDRAYAYPICSPTRSSLLTGRYVGVYGIGQAIHAKDEVELPLDEITLAEALSEHGYRTGAVGKWHLSSRLTPSEYAHPLMQGFESHVGSRGNITDYYDWKKLRNGEQIADNHSTYATTDTTDEAIGFLQSEDERPWFLWLAYNAPHSPFQPPPSHLVDDVPGNDDPIPDIADAMVQAFDDELGRLLHHVDLSNTIVLFMGDNGPDARTNRPPLEDTRAKGTLYEAGIRVPWVMAGPGVRIGETDALIHVTDVFPTVLALLGIDNVYPTHGAVQTAVLQGEASGRDAIFVEMIKPLGPPPYEVAKRTLVTQRYKLHRQDDKERSDSLFDLQEDPMETVDLLEDKSMRTEIAAEYGRLRTLLDRERIKSDYAYPE
jgi:arylsulfatase B